MSDVAALAGKNDSSASSGKVISFVAVQAFGVAVFAGLEYFGLKKSATARVVPA
jgi:hypothetical protein